MIYGSQWERIAYDMLKPLCKHLAQPFSVEFVFEVRFERIDIRRQAAFAPKVVECIFEGR